MWFKFAGTLFILISGTGIGWAIAGRYIYRVNYLEDLYQAVNLINTEIVYNQTRLADALEKTISDIEPPVSVLLQEASDSLQKEKDKIFEEIWRDLLSKSNLYHDDIKIMINWGKKAGSTKLSEQEKNNKITMKRLTIAREKAEKIADKKVKLARYAGILLSFLIIILCY